ncbi:uncharacterized protein FIBRA_07815 [Fibroporia radiculosa]|uniref:C2H2-type domain-containing protein n=1 Tax=Fibroporia radiculosa TaxID=599839 RepID=J4I1F4_9APHY|nr:uncharacterized protein FIBRA_07815 [Fibroporia radiculosa]CCM05587.1 predicted protein [Fibroporia radiculosa]
MSSAKRIRAASATGSSNSPSPEPTPKAVRTSLPSDHSSSASPLLCTLPPTCNPPHNRPTPLASTAELESHYATYHAHVCEERGCACVFPDARLLELHQTECHDPLAAVRKDRGSSFTTAVVSDGILLTLPQFACHLVMCGRCFLTPKTRRLHLIQAHGYPKEYFFAVTNKGVGGLLKRWGEGASMVRAQWKARDITKSGDADSSDDGDGEAERASSQRRNVHVEAEADEAIIEGTISASGLNETGRQVSDSGVVEDTIDSLSGAMGSLSLVPSNVRFGRGTKRGGFNLGANGMNGGGAGNHIAMRGGHKVRGRGSSASVLPTANPAIYLRQAGTTHDVRIPGSMRGVLGAGSLRRGVRGYPATRAEVERIGTDITRENGNERATRGASSAGRAVKADRIKSYTRGRGGRPKGAA